MIYYLFFNSLRKAAKRILAATATKLMTMPSVEAHFSVTSIKLISTQ